MDLTVVSPSAPRPGAAPWEWVGLGYGSFVVVSVALGAALHWLRRRNRPERT